MDIVTAEAPTSTYREFPPSPALASHVLCVWSPAIGEGATSHRHRVLPDGCVDLVWIGEAPPVVAGPATGPVVVPLRPRTVVVGVRLRRGAAPGVIGVRASELANRDTPLRDIWGAAADALWPRIVEQTSIAPRLLALEAVLARRLEDAPPLDRTIAAATLWLAGHPEGQIGELARFLDMGERRLRRRFASAVGYGPKTLQRVLRLQRVLMLARGSSRPSAGLATIAAEAGYADQAHMSRELRALTGRSPATLLRGAASTLELSGLFKTEAEPTL
jgi:AraC-like DNA-binding protein